MNSAERPKLEAPGGASEVLLHSCCAPCEGEVLETMLESGIKPTVFFYNPNIHPKKEYELRKEEDKRFCEKLGLVHHDGDYDVRNWFERVRGMEWEPERGIRCTSCFDMRFERTALFAKEHGFRVFTSCLGISRWKNMAQINGCGERAAARYDGDDLLDLQLEEMWRLTKNAGGFQKGKLLSAGVLWLCLFFTRYKRMEDVQGTKRDRNW